jgi:glutamyl-tRNA synthetase
MSDREVAASVQPFLRKSGIVPDKEMLLSLVPLIKNRIVTFEDSVEWLSFFFTKEIMISPSEFTNKKSTQEETLVILQNVKLTLEQLQEFKHESIETELRSLAETMGLKLGQLLNPVRLAISGQKVSPPLFETLEILGENLVHSRIEKAIKLLDNI